MKFDCHAARARGCTVLVDGEDVTNRCFFVDDEAGLASCWKHNDAGQPYLDPYDPTTAASEVLRGVVEIRLRE